MENAIKERRGLRSGWTVSWIDESECLRAPIHVAVRELIEFILREGSIDNRSAGAASDAMLQGSRLHRKVQKRMGQGYRAEVALSVNEKLLISREEKQDVYLNIVVEGRADGIYQEEDETVIDEIKGVAMNVHRLVEPRPLHLAQAKCYAYFYARQKSLSKIKTRMTYIQLETEETVYFYNEHTFEKLEEWFRDLVLEYSKWLVWQMDWDLDRDKTIKELEFPFPYRPGQRDLAYGVYRSIIRDKRLYIEAPTGVGKTISTLFPAIKAIGEQQAKKLFYLTAKTITRTVAEDTVHLLEQQGLWLKCLTITAKEKICILDKPSCNPGDCPRARGHFDRVNDAVYDLLLHETRISRTLIEEYAKKHNVCPFEMSLDVSLWCDLIICDYNYLFDPVIYLKRFFYAEQEKKGIELPYGNSSDCTNGGSQASSKARSKSPYLFLIDEAHNLVDRARSMYSMTLVKEDFLRMKHLVRGKSSNDVELPTGNSMIALPAVPRHTSRADDEELPTGNSLIALPAVPRHTSRADDEELPTGNSMIALPAVPRHTSWAKLIKRINSCNKTLLSYKHQCEKVLLLPEVDTLVLQLIGLLGQLEEFLTEHREFPGRDELLTWYFDLRRFLLIYELVDEKYRIYADFNEKNEFCLHLCCMDPSNNLDACLGRGRASIFFSATLLPIRYYKEQLAGGADDYAVYAPSPFEIEKRKILIARDVSTVYKRRTEKEFLRIAQYIYTFVMGKVGNYMVFVSSYKMLEQVMEPLREMLGDRIMEESEKREVVEKLRKASNEPIGDVTVKLVGYEDGNAGDGNVEDGNAGVGNAEGGNAGGGNAEYENVEDGNTEDGNAGGGNAGGGNAEDGNAENENVKYGNTEDRNVEEINEKAVSDKSSKSVRLLLQTPSMTEQEKEEFLQAFEANPSKTTIGFCVMGGSFSEGIDLKEDRLIGSVIVGPGLPMVCTERELYKNYFDETRGEGTGFDYAYLYQGMNKVLQSAGRVIRTQKDRGVVLLLDERFGRQQYQSLFPREWFPFEYVNRERLRQRLKEFWEN